MKFLEKIRNYINISGIAPISRRYFIMNAFDGATTVLGVVVGAYAVGITNESWVIFSGLGATLAMGMSGFAGSYMAEEAEGAKKLNTLEKSMLTELKDSMVGKASRFASIWAAIIGGGAPALTGALCLFPFIFATHGFLPINLAVQISIVLALSIMFILGAILGRISCRNMFFHGAKMLLVGLILTFIFFMLRLT
jgi:predicted membrane protein (TIGR00267 family)